MNVHARNLPGKEDQNLASNIISKQQFNKELEIIEAQKKDALEQQAMKFHRNERKYIFSALLAIVIIGSIFYRNYQRKKKDNKRLSRQKEEIELQAKELSESNKKLLRLAKFKQDMTNMIVHDLKNPISAIINVSKIDDWPDKDLMIEYSGKQLLNLVTNILDVDKYEQMDFQLFKREVNIQKSINIALEDVSFILKNKGINIELNLVENSCVIADREIINRVLVNLLTNAIKFSPNNGTIDITASIKNQDELYVGIKNDGPGIQKDMHKSIFEMYQQHDVRPSGGVASSGIGLSFCKLSIEAHNGTIGVKSETKTGVEFWFTIPNAELIEE
ncbi:sensor histidine kinase [Carboxylicivirga sp. N1Y90]|uniref:sensor histidine kinase n=1 Tax=Carboxylicivirga fragile TaxID=3417571 RepID=UPI003D32860B|nr:hypothetical protein [Marinilabiliaceae bacterium N1Y90]